MYKIFQIALLKLIVWRFRRKYRKGCKASVVSNEYLYRCVKLKLEYENLFSKLYPTIQVCNDKHYKVLCKQLNVLKIKNEYNDLQGNETRFVK